MSIIDFAAHSVSEFFQKSLSKLLFFQLLLLHSATRVGLEQINTVQSQLALEARTVMGELKNLNLLFNMNTMILPACHSPPFKRSLFVVICIA